MSLPNRRLLHLGILALFAGASLLCHPLACSAQPFIGDISRWKAQDDLARPEAGSLLFVGSSSIRRWEALTRDFADYKVIQRGFGGSQFEHLIAYVDDIVLPYKPAAIVVWQGTNDIKDGEAGDEVFADYQQFVSTVHASLPKTPIFYLGIMPTEGRFALEAQNARANRQVASVAASNPLLYYIDLPAEFHRRNPPRDPQFRALFVDSIHLNSKGYELWTSIIRPQIETVVPPNKVFTPNPRTLQAGDRLLFDFGPSNAKDGDATLDADRNEAIWNNWHTAKAQVAVNAGEHLHDLVNASGAATGIDLVITGGFSTGGKQHGGLRKADRALLGELAVHTATQDYFFCSADDRRGGNDDSTGGFMLTGLDPNLAYDFSFFGSCRDAETRVTNYTVMGSNHVAADLHTSGLGSGATQNYHGNEANVARIAGVRPDRFGQVFVDLTVVKGQFAYLAAMAIEATTAGR